MSQLQFRVEINLGAFTTSTSDAANHSYVWARANEARDASAYSVDGSCIVSTKYDLHSESPVHVLMVTGIQLSEHRDAGVWRASVCACVKRVAKIYGIAKPIAVYFTNGFADTVVQ